MAEIIQIERDGVIQYPITKPECVIDENGKNLKTQLTELSTEVGKRNVGAVDTNDSVEEPEIPVPTPSVSNEWKCVVDRMMVEGERILTFETFADGTPLNAKELIVQVEIVEKSNDVVNGYVRVQSTNNKNLSYYGPINYSDNVNVGRLECVHMQASPFYMVADLKTLGYKVGTHGKSNVSGGGLTDKFEVYENFVMVQLYPNSTIDTPPYIKIYAR